MHFRIRLNPPFTMIKLTLRAGTKMLESTFLFDKYQTKNIEEIECNVIIIDSSSKSGCDEVSISPKKVSAASEP